MNKYKKHEVKEEPQGIHPKRKKTKESEKSQVEENNRISRLDEEEEVFHHFLVKPPDGGWGWVVVLSAFFCNMIIDGIQYNFGNFLQPIRESFNSSIMEISLIGALMSGFYNFSGPIGSALVNKFGFRMVAITGSLIGAAGFLMSYFATKPMYLYFTYGVLGGLGFGMIYMASVISTTMYFERLRALASSMSVCGTGIGTFVFSPLGDTLVNNLGWRWALVCEGGMAMLCILFGIAFKPLSVTDIEFYESSSRESFSSLYAATTSEKVTAEFPPQNGLDRISLHNGTLPTFKQALMKQAEGSDSRRASITAVKKWGRRSSNVPSIALRSLYSTSEESEEEILSLKRDKISKLERYKCRNNCRRCCFNFCLCRCTSKKELTTSDRPLYRDDIFYEGSLARLPIYSSVDPLDYRMSVTRVPGERDAEQHIHQQCCVCHEAMLRTCATMTGLNLLRSVTFFFLCISSFLFTMGIFIPYVFIRELATNGRIPDEKSVWLVSCMGISNTMGRIISGILTSFTKVGPAFIVVACLLVSGGISFIVLLPINLECTFLFACVFGFFTAPFISLRPIILVDFLGLDKLTNAFGLVLLSQGIASVIGPPVAGLMASAGEIRYPFLMAGSLMLCSAVTMIVAVSCDVRHRSRNGVKKSLMSKKPARATLKEDDEDEEEEFAIEPPNGGWGWVVVFAAFYCNTVTDGVQLTFGVFLNDIASYFEVEKSKIALAGSLMFGTHLLMGPLCAGLSNTFGIRPVAFSGSMIGAAGLSLSYFMPRYELLYPTCGVLLGIGLGLVYMNTLIITSLYFSSLRALAIGLVVCGSGFGTVVFALAANQMLKTMTWKEAFVIEGALLASMGIAALTFRPLKPKKLVTTTNVPLPQVEGRQSRSESSSSIDLSRRRTTVYMKKMLLPPSFKVSAFNMTGQALEQIATEAAVPQATARCCPASIRKCFGCRTSQQNVIFVHPDNKGREIFNDAAYRSRNVSRLSSIFQPFGENASEYVFSRLPAPERVKKEVWCKPLRDTISNMLNCRLLGSFSYLLFVISGALSMGALITVFTYERGRAMQHGVPENMAIYFIVAIGGSNMFWRLILGGISTLTCTNHHYINIFGMILGGTATACSGLKDDMWYQFLYCFFLAFGMATFAVFRAVILVELVGTEQVVNATGISLMFMGVAGVATPPVCGMAMEATKDYDTIFYIAGSLFAFSGMLMAGVTIIMDRNN